MRKNVCAANVAGKFGAFNGRSVCKGQKIFFFLTALFVLIYSGIAQADAAGELQRRLSIITYLNASFTQTVSSADGKNVQNGHGILQIRRPNLFIVRNKAPQENRIISDGKTLWFYDPFVEQVTANWLEDAVNDTPFVLLTSNDPAYWKPYSVEQIGDIFAVKPKAKNSNLRQFDIRIDKEGILKSFGMIEKDGQFNLYILRNIITNVALSTELFEFSVPKGAEFDDQRKKAGNRHGRTNGK
ncbi:outer membrane lipoprotein carrier protein [Mesocricetibacter intestinalis]|uniref:Outer-membrane lipoprotein carrier protein n=1 Tax=Mesocricetibacter intestinalis TaxID=1521930 RepID=A0A4R6VAF0_9PAST|nr:outer membrane lipoprotein chaperone LolA [Mesocricetibacter intestinalis]TDQ57040.1 outer membrane lipoprotein carrier protein [Mesocricetibacter intestinalis]